MKSGSGKNVRIKIKGLVQGIGFRPFVYRVAVANNISGWVMNRQDGLIIEASGKIADVETFLSGLKTDFPEAAQINDFKIYRSANNFRNGFRIIESVESSDEKEITQIGPDMAVCTDCLADLKTQHHRIDYPFINCTNCGPRFTIIQNLPYDREKTTMHVFNMCQVCKTEYENPGNRRFHAQPIACLKCGPKYRFNSHQITSRETSEIVCHTARFIDDGKIIAVKGIGGFFIACDATNASSVTLLRKKKNREGKPFAVLFKDVATVNTFCFLDTFEEEMLKSWRRPIVVLKSKNKLPEAVSNQINTVGALLPYMPFHYLLFEKLKTQAMVFTSGNFADEPIIISNNKAEAELLQICDAVVDYNREIYNRTDDSLLQIIHNKPRLMRRSRGFVPAPVYLNFNVDGIFAAGAELKNTFCFGKGNQAILSQHIGDLKDFETYSFYEKNIEQFKTMFRVTPILVAADLHPEYLSTKYAREMQLPVIHVQHHHAHIASAMAENNLNEKLIGVCFDGGGLGDDGNIWGSEFFVCDLSGFERKLHFKYIPLPGGDAATNEPWKIAISYLFSVYEFEFLSFNLPFLKNVDEKKIQWVLKSIIHKINCPLTSGSGRLFDAIAALTGFCNYATFEAEAPMRLENAIVRNENSFYSFKLSQVIDFSEMIAEIIRDLKQNTNLGTISAKFHNTISESIVAGVKKINTETGLRKVVLSGGTFQNRYLTERTENMLRTSGFEVFSNCIIPCNDGGISLGQLAVAAKKHLEK